MRRLLWLLAWVKYFWYVDEPDLRDVRARFVRQVRIVRRKV